MKRRDENVKTKTWRLRHTETYIQRYGVRDIDAEKIFLPYPNRLPYHFDFWIKDVM